MVIGLLCCGYLWRYKWISKHTERESVLWRPRHYSKHLIYITLFNPHSNLWGLLLVLLSFYRKRNQGWERLTVTRSQNVKWASRGAWCLGLISCTLGFTETLCTNTQDHTLGTDIWSWKPGKLQPDIGLCASERGHTGRPEGYRRKKLLHPVPLGKKDDPFEDLLM